MASKCSLGKSSKLAAVLNKLRIAVGSNKISNEDNINNHNNDDITHDNKLLDEKPNNTNSNNNDINNINIDKVDDLLQVGKAIAEPVVCVSVNKQPSESLELKNEISIKTLLTVNKSDDINLNEKLVNESDGSLLMNKQIEIINHDVSDHSANTNVTPDNDPDNKKEKDVDIGNDDEKSHPSKKSSRRKQQKTHKVVEQLEINMDDSLLNSPTSRKNSNDSYHDQQNVDFKYVIDNNGDNVNNPKNVDNIVENSDNISPSSSSSVVNVNDENVSHGEDYEEEFVLPEGTVFVQPESVDASPTTFNIETSRPKRVFKGGNLDSAILHCTACNKQIGLDGTLDYHRHPVLKVLICRKCYQWYTSGEIDQDSEGTDEQCRWCRQGGDLICCDFCHNSFCKGCVRRNLGRKELNSILDGDESSKWKCYVCNPKPLLSLIEHCSAVMEALTKLEKKQQEMELKRTKRHHVKSATMATGLNLNVTTISNLTSNSAAAFVGGGDRGSGHVNVVGYGAAGGGGVLGKSHARSGSVHVITGSNNSSKLGVNNVSGLNNYVNNNIGSSSGKIYMNTSGGALGNLVYQVSPNKQATTSPTFNNNYNNHNLLYQQLQQQQNTKHQPQQHHHSSKNTSQQQPHQQQQQPQRQQSSTANISKDNTDTMTKSFLNSFPYKNITYSGQLSMVEKLLSVTSSMQMFLLSLGDELQKNNKVNNANNHNKVNNNNNNNNRVINSTGNININNNNTRTSNMHNNNNNNNNNTENTNNNDNKNQSTATTTATNVPAISATTTTATVTVINNSNLNGSISKPNVTTNNQDSSTHDIQPPSINKKNINNNHDNNNNNNKDNNNNSINVTKVNNKATKPTDLQINMMSPSDAFIAKRRLIASKLWQAQQVFEKSFYNIAEINANPKSSYNVYNAYPSNNGIKQTPSSTAVKGSGSSNSNTCAVSGSSSSIGGPVANKQTSCHKSNHAVTNSNYNNNNTNNNYSFTSLNQSRIIVSPKNVNPNGNKNNINNSNTATKIGNNIHNAQTAPYTSGYVKTVQSILNKNYNATSNNNNNTNNNNTTNNNINSNNNKYISVHIASRQLNVKPKVIVLNAAEANNNNNDDNNENNKTNNRNVIHIKRSSTKRTSTTASNNNIDHDNTSISANNANISVNNSTNNTNNTNTNISFNNNNKTTHPYKTLIRPELLKSSTKARISSPSNITATTMTTASVTAVSAITTASKQFVKILPKSGHNKNNNGNKTTTCFTTDAVTTISSSSSSTSIISTNKSKDNPVIVEVAGNLPAPKNSHSRNKNKNEDVMRNEVKSVGLPTNTMDTTTISTTTAINDTVDRISTTDTTTTNTETANSNVADNINNISIMNSDDDVEEEILIISDSDDDEGEGDDNDTGNPVNHSDNPVTNVNEGHGMIKSVYSINGGDKIGVILKGDKDITTDVNSNNNTTTITNTSTIISTITTSIATIATDSSSAISTATGNNNINSNSANDETSNSNFRQTRRRKLSIVDDNNNLNNKNISDNNNNKSSNNKKVTNINNKMSKSECGNESNKVHNDSNRDVTIENGFAQINDKIENDCGGSAMKKVKTEQIERNGKSRKAKKSGARGCVGDCGVENGESINESNGNNVVCSNVACSNVACSNVEHSVIKSTDLGNTSVNLGIGSHNNASTTTKIDTIYTVSRTDDGKMLMSHGTKDEVDKDVGNHGEGKDSNIVRKNKMNNKSKDVEKSSTSDGNTSNNDINTLNEKFNNGKIADNISNNDKSSNPNNERNNSSGITTRRRTRLSKQDSDNLQISTSSLSLSQSSSSSSSPKTLLSPTPPSSSSSSTPPIPSSSSVTSLVEINKRKRKISMEVINRSNKVQKRYSLPGIKTVSKKSVKKYDIGDKSGNKNEVVSGAGNNVSSKIKNKKSTGSKSKQNDVPTVTNTTSKNAKSKPSSSLPPSSSSSSSLSPGNNKIKPRRISRKMS